MTESKPPGSTLYVPSAHDEFQMPDSPEAYKYIPLDPKYLHPSGACEFSIYVYHPGRNRFVMFKKEDASIQKDQIDTLTKGGRQPIFVPHEYSYQLNEYLSENLSEIVDDPNLPLEEKTEKFHTMATSVMKGLFENPPDNETFVRTAKNVSDATSELIVHGPKAISQLNALRSYDYYTYSHSMNVTVLSLGLYQELVPNATMEQIKDLTRGVLLHDIGKRDVPTELTNKRGPLTESEWDVMRSHTTKGYERLDSDKDLSDDSRYVSLYHHEAVDGTGYPTKIKISEIPFTSRVCKVCDVYDALTSRRSYKNGMKPFETLQIMQQEMKTKIDQDILKQFIMFLQKMGKLNVRKAE